ncbi:hypothetical protein AQUCO_04400130v1 [Aquilegia coerulea]|uniref:Uncharacterized protein n=1 Tax=Aquilegia coerulea TaxID=218851 RepID=A0A2G5CNA9_AQUCA|nr:hypothetical protein AQUCO_04400130v1 [Aquilegia coerulea]
MKESANQESPRNPRNSCYTFPPTFRFSKFIDIESIERTSNTCSTFGRPCVISLDLDFSYRNVTNLFPS